MGSVFEGPLQAASASSPHRSTRLDVPENRTDGSVARGVAGANAGERSSKSASGSVQPGMRASRLRRTRRFGTWSHHPGARMATLIDGKAIAAKVRAEVAEGVKARLAKGLRAPGLAVVRVGEDPASKIYIGGKRKACSEVGMQSWEHVFPETATQDEVANKLRELNADPAVHGILVQLPIPKQLDDRALLNLVDAKKDVDGFHPMNLGAMVMGLPAPRACTPFGVMRLLQEAGCDPAGKRAVVIGR